jgi:hypothetical protein
LFYRARSFGVVVVLSLLLNASSLISISQASSITLVGVRAISSGGATSSGDGSTFSNHSVVYGYGVLFGSRIISRWKAQLGFLYVTRGFDQSIPSTGQSLEYSFSTLQIPLIFQYSLFPALALGLGGYFAPGVGSVGVGPPGQPATSAYSYGDGGFRQIDTGLVLSVELKIVMMPTLSVIGDIRYLYGLNEIGQNPAVGGAFRDLQCLVGLRFGR